MNRYSTWLPVRGLVAAILFLAQHGCSERQEEFIVTPSSLELAASDGGPSVRDVVVQLNNLTRVPVTILDVQSTCVCTVAQPLEASRIEPGQSLPLALRVALPDYGSAAAEVAIETDLAIQPRQVVHIDLRGKDRPIPHLLRQTEMLELTGTTAEEPVEGIVFAEMIEKAGSLPMVTGLTASSGNATAELVAPPLEDPGPPDIVRRRYQFKVMARVPVSEAESFRLRVSTRELLASEARLALDTTVYLRRHVCLRVTPAIVILSPAESGAFVERQLIISATDGASFEVKPATGAAGYTVQTSRIQTDGSEARAIVVLKFDVAQFGQQREVELLTTHAKCGVVRIPVHLLTE